jgi:beta-lactamase class A
MYKWVIVVLWIVLLLSGCGGQTVAEPVATVEPTQIVTLPTATPISAETTPTLPTSTPTPQLTPTPFVIANPSTACGTLLPIQLGASFPTVTTLPATPLPENIPDLAVSAVERLLSNPDDVSLVAYRADDPANGIFINADTAFPLASVVKLAHLIAYVNAVEARELDPTTVVPLTDIEAFYLPNSDLGAHNEAIRELRNAGKLAADNTAVLLRDVPWMMMRHSSNAATDYLHDLLGQERIEQTIVDLGLGLHSAPCPFIGRFLLQHNHARTGQSDTQALADLIADPTFYGSEVARLTDTFSQNDAFRSAETRWGRPLPRGQTQRDFTAALDTQGTARAYANLMARIATGELGSPYGNALIRSYLDWPLEAFENNQSYFSDIGYKNGTLPGVMTTVYYAQPWDSAEPIIVALFYRNLPQRTYQQWRRNLPHDELAHWLLRDPDALETLKRILE